MVVLEVVQVVDMDPLEEAAVEVLARAVLLEVQKAEVQLALEARPVLQEAAAREVLQEAEH